jgi:hypothetical protein
LADYDRYYFDDINFKMKWNASLKDRIYLSLYHGKDAFNNTYDKDGTNEEKDELHWGNIGGSLRWNKIFSNSVFGNATLIYSDYEFVTEQSSYTNGTPNYILAYSSKMKEMTAKADADWLINNDFSLRGGISYSTYHLRPGESLQLYDTTSSQAIYDYKPVGAAVYTEIAWNINTKLKLEAGFREDIFHNEATLSSLQPRIRLNYRSSELWSLHAGYSRTNQNMHQLSNTSLGLPSDLWVPALDNLPNEEADIIAAGSRIKKGKLSFSLDAYYRTLRNMIDYKPGSSFLILSKDIAKNNYPDWTQNVAQG